MTCGGDGPQVIVTVNAAAAATQIRNLAQIELSVVHDNRRVAFSSAPYTSGAELTFDHIPHEDDLVIGLVGRDSDGVPLAYGSASPGKLSDSGDCCITLCLCTEELQAVCNACGAIGCQPCTGQFAPSPGN